MSERHPVRWRSRRSAALALSLVSLAVVALAVLGAAGVLPGSERVGSVFRGDEASPPASVTVETAPVASREASSEPKARPTGRPPASSSPGPTPVPSLATRGPGIGSISGTVLFGPTCPVERPESPCPDRPGPAEVRVLRRGTGSVVASAQAGEDGRFVVEVQPGDYTVTAVARFGCDARDVMVGREERVRITISCDTGIR